MTPTPQQKAIAVAAYKGAIDLLAAGGFLTSDQAAALKADADTL